jgi:hypothetical protein
MAQDDTGGNSAASDREGAASSGWVTTQVAAKSLGISPRTVRWHIEQGNLAAKPEGKGVRRSWLVSISSVQAFRDSRQRKGQSPGRNRVEHGSADIDADSSGNAIRELADRLVVEAARASEYRVRLELSEMAQSTLEEQLAEERRRREEAEQERDSLSRALRATHEGQTPPEGTPPLEGQVLPPSYSAGTDEAWDDVATGRLSTGSTGDSRPWWRRLFGG